MTTIIQDIGNTLCIKPVTGTWQLAESTALFKEAVFDNSPVTGAVKAKLPLFGYGRDIGTSRNEQLYPTNHIILEVDAPKSKLASTGDALTQQVFIQDVFRKCQDNPDIHYKLMYITSSMGGLRFILETDKPVKDEAEYRTVVKQFLEQLRQYGVTEDYYDIRVNQGWYVPTFADFIDNKGLVYHISVSSAEPKTVSAVPLIAGEDNKENIEKIEALISIGQSITSSHQEWFTVAAGLSKSFSYEVGKDLYLRLCRLDDKKHDEAASIKQWDTCYKRRDIASATTTINTVFYIARNKGITFDKAQDGTQVTIPLMLAIALVKSRPEEPNVWRGIKQPSVNLIFGMAKSNKTMLAENLAMSVACGRNEFLGDRINIENRKVLVLNLEEFFDNRIRRNITQLQELTKAEQGALGDNFHVLSEHCSGYISTDQDWERIVKPIAERRPGLVVIDSLSHLYMGQIEKSSTAQELLAKLREIARTYNCVILVVHHTVKMDGRAIRMVDMAGSRFISQDADGIIGMNKSPNKQLYLVDIAYRYARLEEMCKVLKLNDNLWLQVVEEKTEEEIFDQSIPDGRQDLTNANTILDFMKNCEGEVTIKELEQEFVKSGAMSGVTLHKWLNWYIASKEISRTQKGIYKLFRDDDTPESTLTVVPTTPALPVQSSETAVKDETAETPDDVIPAVTETKGNAFEEAQKQYASKGTGKGFPKLEALKD